MVNASDLIKLLDFNLSTKRLNNAFDLLKEEQYSKLILTHYSDVLEVVMKYMTGQNYTSQPDVYETCESIVKYLSEKCFQEGILFEYLEIIETVKDDDVFTSILKGLQIIILNQTEKKSRALEYCLNSIEDYVEELPLSESLTKNVEDEEEKLLENNDQVRRILMMYVTLDLFYDPIAKQIVLSKPKSSEFRSNKFDRTNVLFCFILRLFGKPLSYLDLSHDAENNNVKTYSRQSRKFSIQTVHYADKKLDDFRAREEQKEAEFNKEPVVDELNKKEEEHEEEDEEVLEVRKKILEASLTFVQSVGWTREAIVKGAEQASFPGTVHGMFARGGIELIDYYYLKCNQQLVEEMKIRTNNGEKCDEKPTEFVKWAIKQRLLMLEPYLNCWPQALAMMTLPQNVPKSLANMLTLVDDICFFTGDRSIDFNWYARRIGLATIYKATELYMLTDKSPNFDNSWLFLERRLADATVVHDILLQSSGATKHLEEAVSTAFTTARNILGLNYERR
ncbi:unnamed protein product [Diamesa serratosioi]